MCRILHHRKGPYGLATYEPCLNLPPDKGELKVFPLTVMNFPFFSLVQQLKQQILTKFLQLTITKIILESYSPPRS